MKITVSENPQLIYITVQGEEDRVFSWEELQEVKDHFHPNEDFIEVFPKKGEIVNKGNVRHLFHVKGVGVPYLGDVETEMETKHYEMEFKTNKQLRQEYAENRQRAVAALNELRRRERGMGFKSTKGGKYEAE